MDTSPTRVEICEWLGFSNPSQKTDLLNDDLTSTDLIEFLVQLKTKRPEPKGILVTSVRSDHPTYDGPNGHSGGNAIDFIDNSGAPLHLLKAVQECEAAKGIGLGGDYAWYAEQCGGYNADSKLFEDNNSTHFHVQVKGY